MNRRLLSASACTFALLLTGCGGDTDATKAYVAAGQKLEAKVGAPGEKAQMPTKDDADVKAFDAESEKALTALGTDAMPLDGIDSYEKLCGPAAKIIAAYASAGVGATKDGSLAMDDQAKVAAMTANVERYMDQMFTPLLFAAHCTAAHIPAIEAKVDDKREGKAAEALNQVRGGAFGQATGLLQMAGDPSTAPDRRKKLVDLVARDAGNFAAAMNQAQRAQFTQLADAVAQSAPDSRAQMEQVKAAVQKAPCGKLCSS